MISWIITLIFFPLTHLSHHLPLDELWSRSFQSQKSVWKEERDELEGRWCKIRCEESKKILNRKIIMEKLWNWKWFITKRIKVKGKGTRNWLNMFIVGSGDLFPSRLDSNIKTKSQNVDWTSLNRAPVYATHRYGSLNEQFVNEYFSSLVIMLYFQIHFLLKMFGVNDEWPGMQIQYKTCASSITAAAVAQTWDGHFQTAHTRVYITVVLVFPFSEAVDFFDGSHWLFSWL